MYPVDFLHPGEDFTTLGKLREISYQHKIPHWAVQSRKHGSATDRLEHGINKAGGNILRRRVAIRLSKQRSGSAYG